MRITFRAAQHGMLDKTDLHHRPRPSFRAWKHGGVLTGILSLILAHLVAPSAVCAQTDSQSANSSETRREGTPRLLYVLQADDAKASRKDELTLLVRDRLRDMLRESRKFDVQTFGIKQAIIQRALLEHAITTNDLIPPFKTDALQRVARAVGARYILRFSVNQTTDTATADTLFLESVGLEEWRTLFSEQIVTENKVSRRLTDKNRLVSRRMNTSELADMIVDQIGARMGLPSRKPAQPADATGRATKAPDDKTAKTADTGTSGANSDFVPIAGSDAKPDVKARPDKTNQNKTNQNQKPSGNDRSVPVKDDPKSQAGKKTATKEPPTNGTEKNPARPAAPGDSNGFSADTTPGRADPPTLAPTPPASRLDPEAQANRFRQSGDLANVITSLRHAINERPRDAGLRRELVQAYQERKLFDAALAEVNRALQLSPKESSLHRLRGDTLLARGDTAAAMQAYREAIQNDPNDIASQVALGDALLTDNQFAEAINTYTSAAKNDPKSPLPHRRLARAYAGRAGSDITQYAASLEQIQQARALTPAADTETYLDDYIALMHLMETRMRDILDQSQNTYRAVVSGKTTDKNELKRLGTDMKDRASAAADYLDKLPPAAGQDATHARYQQAAALLTQTISLFRDFAATGDTLTEEKLKSTQLDTLRTLNAAGKRLNAARSTPDIAKPANEGTSDTVTTEGKE